MDSHILQFFDCLWTVLFDDVCYRNDSDKFAVFCEEQRTFAVLSQSFRLLADCVGNFRSLCNVFQVAAGQDCAVQLSGQTAARYSLEIATSRVSSTPRSLPVSKMARARGCSLFFSRV